MSLYSTAVKKPITTALVFVAISIIGLFSLSRLSIDLYPSIETNMIMVLTSYDGASASDIENNVTKPLENFLNTVPNLKEISSDSKENISVITLEFNYGSDIEVATNDVRDKLDAATTYLPDEIETPTIFKFGTDDIPILLLSVTARESMPALYKILDDKVANPLKRISGVGTVSINGIAKREIQIYCDPQRLEAYNLSIEGIAQVIAAENRNTPGGSLDIGSNTYGLRVQGEFVEVSELNGIIVGSQNGKSIYLRDVASIFDGPQEKAQESYTDGKQGGVIVVQKQSGANSVDISREVLAQLPEIQKTLPSDVTIGEIANTSTNIENTIQSLIDTVSVTFLIVMFVVLFFLGRWRATFIIILTIPLSLIASFVYLMATGNTLNIVSLSSLGIAIGMVVDDAIVVLENITTHIERGSDPKQAAVHATNEVAISVVASTLTLLAVFLPLTMISGLSGIMFRQLGWIVSIIMIISTTAALTLTPMLSSRMLRLDGKQGKLHRILFTPIERLLDWLDSGYRRLLYWAVRHRALVILSMAAIFVGSMFLFGQIKTDFFPAQDNGRIGATLELPVGTRYEIARETSLEIEARWREMFPEIVVSNFTVGQADSDNAWGSLQQNGSHIVSFNLKLTNVTERERGMIEICDLMREDLKSYPLISKYKVLAGGGGGGMGGQNSVDVEIYGYDFAMTDKAARDFAALLREYPIVTEVNISREDYVPEIQVDFDREKLAINGLNISTAASYLRNRINGLIASFYREDGDEYNIRVRYDRDSRQTIEDIENILIYNNQGKGIRVRDLGTVVERMTPPTIERKNRERIITISAIAAEGAALSDIALIAKECESRLDLPDELSVDYTGSYEEQQESFGDLGLLMVLVIILVYIVLASQFESFSDPFIIMLSLPFALSGVIFGLLLTDTSLSIMTFIGIIMLVGIVVKNGIVLIDYTILNRERGMSILAATVDAGRSRLRPVLMTSLTTIFGMVPMAIGTGEGSELWRPMGVSVAWGLSFSTLITLLLIPTLYCVFAGVGIKRSRRKMAKALRTERRRRDLEASLTR